MALSLVLMVLVSVLAYWYLKLHFGVFERYGIPGPKPVFLLGNIIEIMKKGQLQAIIDWRKTYGKAFGYFEGFTPVLSISDPAVVREVLVKDFTNFQARKPFPLAPRKSLGLFLENGHQWRRSRSILSPAFSTSKLRTMTVVMEQQIDKLLQNLGTQQDKGIYFDIYRQFQSLTLDVIGRCAFGLHTNAQLDLSDAFLNNIQSLFRNMSTTVILPIVMLFPFVQYFIFAIKNVVLAIGMNPVSWLRHQIIEVIRIRREIGNDGSVTDLMQQMLFHSDKHQKMTDREIVAQSLTFLLAGYETTSAVLAFHCHLLAKNPEAQRRIRREIKQLGQEKISYQSVQKLPYLDMVFDEVCRLYPTASLIVTRQAAAARTYGHVYIPTGMNVQVDVWGLHHDTQFWDHPEKFMPERFSPENKSQIRPYTFMPFGAGPRNCIGSRFAMLETKIAVARIIKDYELKPANSSQDDLNLLCRGAIVPKDGVHVKLVHARNAKAG
ncbi:cytochrome P450 3A11-like [Mizuhopecten yessoensis]|uniref:cytochrome P450 3A11-like n=1 Tax=Mizuhopecten yessoensis TaxID=6573 RepID=UPI000B45EBBF|nr:cytochrome P450 3A11-like [Mizuhopecten yessoensis]